MPNCTKCGTEMPNNMKYCITCGTPAQAPTLQAPPTLTGTAGQAAPPPAPSFEAPKTTFTPPVVPVYAPPTVKTAPLTQNQHPTIAPIFTMGQYFWTMVLFSLPIAGWIICLVSAFSNTNNPNKRNLAKAFVLMWAIGLAISVIASVIMIFAIRDGAMVSPYHYFY